MVIKTNRQCAVKNFCIFFSLLSMLIMILTGCAGQTYSYNAALPALNPEQLVLAEEQVSVISSQEVTESFDGDLFDSVQDDSIHHEPDFIRGTLQSPVNGMIRAAGVNKQGEEIFGWIHISDMTECFNDPHITPERTRELQRQASERFHATGEYSIAINLYDDEYATTQIGVFHVIVYLEGHNITHGISGGGVIYGRPPGY